MKKIFIFLMTVLVIIAIIGVKYISYKNEKNLIQSENAEFEDYKDKEVYGLTVGTLINKAVDKNTKNKVEKDDKGNFIQNDENSIEIELHMIENDKDYELQMESPPGQRCRSPCSPRPAQSFPHSHGPAW